MKRVYVVYGSEKVDSKEFSRVEWIEGAFFSLDRAKALVAVLSKDEPGVKYYLQRLLVEE